MTPKQVSKAMSRLLRHPNQDIHLDRDGTTSMGLLCDVIGCALADVYTAVGHSSHRGTPRFELVGTGISARIRATGGHTVVVSTPVSSTGTLGSPLSAAAAGSAAAAHIGAARPHNRGAKRQRQGKFMAPKQVSKAMSKLLRHPNQDIDLDPDGTTSAGLLCDVIGCELADVHTAIGRSSYRGTPRFELVGTGGNARVRATGGHTVVVDISQPLHLLYPDM